MAGNASVKEKGVRFRSDRCVAVKSKVVGHIPSRILTPRRNIQPQSEKMSDPINPLKAGSLRCSVHRHLKIPLRSVGVVLDISAAVKWRFNPTNFKCMFLLGKAIREGGRAYFSCPFLDPKRGEFLPGFPATISFSSSQRKKRNKRFWRRRRIPIFLPFLNCFIFYCSF